MASMHFNLQRQYGEQLLVRAEVRFSWALDGVLGGTLILIPLHTCSRTDFKIVLSSVLSSLFVPVDFQVSQN